MNSFKLLEEIGNLPLETIQVKEAGKMRRVFIPCVAAVLSMILLVEGGILIHRYMLKPALPEQQPPAQSLQPPADSNATQTQPAARFGPVTAFGLAPLEGESVSLLAENVVFTKDTTSTGILYGFYTTEMHYTVELSGKASFVLPYAMTRETEKYVQTEIYIDGSPIDFKTERHPNASVEVPILYAGGGRHSVKIYGSDHWKDADQPSHTYTLLMQAWKEKPVPPFTEESIARMIEKSSAGWIDMDTFEIGEAGTHEIEIRLVVRGESDLCSSYMLEWAASPENMWAQAKERNMSVVIGEETYSFAIQDTLFLFEQPRETKE